MLREFLAWLAISCPGPSRRLGLAAESVGIAFRHRRCARAWEPHLARCKSLVLAAARDCPGRGLAVVVGSGPLLDVPLAGLSDLFDRVVLADAVHPRAARRAAAALPNVELLQFDATGLHAELAALCRDRRGPLPAPAPPVLPGPRPDFLVSLNLLSQLAIRPVAALRRSLADPDEAGLRALARSLVDAHLAWLPGAADRVCLVSDFLRLVRGDRGEMERADLLHGAVLPPGETWEWLLAPRPEARADADVVHLVRGAPDLGLALKAG
ncbi:MAG: hypothetical protein AB1916_02170 [Thermodesulfobacteriota bacterium]